MIQSPIYDFIKGVASGYLEEIIEKRFRITSRFELKSASMDFDNSKITSDENGCPFYSDGTSSYRVRYYLPRFRKKFFQKAPKIHVIDCETRHKYSGFKATNTQLNDYFGVGENLWYRHQNLEICGNCLKKLRETLAINLWDCNWDELILSFEEADQTKCRDCRADGYVWIWPQISEALRRLRDYTCEECKLHIQDREHRYFMQAHHIDHDKLNNARSNLRCLCVLCHSQQDDLHRTNFSSVDNQILLKKFNRCYGYYFENGK